jgi:hypothetical protein
MIGASFFRTLSLVWGRTALHSIRSRLSFNWHFTFLLCILSFDQMLFHFSTTAFCSIGSFFFPVQLFLLSLIRYPDLPLIGFINFSWLIFLSFDRAINHSFVDYPIFVWKRMLRSAQSINKRLYLFARTFRTCAWSIRSCAIVFRNAVFQVFAALSLSIKFCAHLSSWCLFCRRLFAFD